MDDNIDKLIRKIKEFVIKYKVILCVIIAISIVMYGYNYITQDKDIQSVKNQYASENDSNEKNKEESKNNKIVIHIDGEVNKPGVYTLDSNSRLDDLVKIAGGLTSEANTSNVNLAQVLNDGQKIHIYGMDEEIEEENNQDNNTSNGKVNINTADIGTLKTLNGIGDATAKKIIDYRESNGKFDVIEDIQNVSGIGQSKYNNIKDNICVR